MTIQIQLNDGTTTELKRYENIARHNYSDYVAGFFANKNYYKWGKMVQFKGNQTITLHTFGDMTE